jgi:hypothetical protein
MQTAWEGEKERGRLTVIACDSGALAPLAISIFATFKISKSYSTHPTKTPFPAAHRMQGAGRSSPTSLQIYCSMVLLASIHLLNLLFLIDHNIAFWGHLEKISAGFSTIVRDWQKHYVACNILEGWDGALGGVCCYVGLPASAFPAAHGCSTRVIRFCLGNTEVSRSQMVERRVWV